MGCLLFSYGMNMRGFEMRGFNVGCDLLCHCDPLVCCVGIVIAAFERQLRQLTV